MKWQEVENIQNEFYKMNAIEWELKQINGELWKSNCDKDYLVKKLEKQLDLLDNQSGKIFNLIEAQRNK